MRERADTDNIGRHLENLARMARSFPPAYLAHGIREPVLGADGSLLGHVLDGKGLYLNTDLKRLGITKKIPHVYERSLTARILDKIGCEEGAITAYDAVINARANGLGEDVFCSKNSYTTVANVWSTSFRAGGFPGAGAYTNIPAGAVMTNASAGALSLGLTNPAVGKTKYLLTMGSFSSSQINCIMLVDLLVAAGNILATSAIAQTVSSAALTRNTTGAGVYMTFDVTTALGGTAANITVSYTNQAGTAGQVTPAAAMTTSAIAQRLQPAVNGPPTVLAAGDTGVRAVASVTLSASMLAGVLALNLFKPLIYFPGLAANVYGSIGAQAMLMGLQDFKMDGSNVIGCLTTYNMTNTTTSGINGITLQTCTG